MRTNRKKMSNFHPLKIKEIIRETPEAVSISFEIPENLKETFHFSAGQYITIKFDADGTELRRSYSLCSAPNSDEFKVTVKEVEGGRFSVIANNKLVAGDILEVHPPEGRFTLTPGSEAKITQLLPPEAGSRRFFRSSRPCFGTNQTAVLFWPTEINQ